MINGERIRQAREIAGMTQERLAHGAGITQAHIALFEQNLRSPQEETMKSIALATGFPLNFFRRESGPEFPMGSLLYRRRKSMTSRDQDRVRQIGRLVFEAIENMSAEFKPIELRLPRLAESSPEEAARITRAELGFSPDSPITNLMFRLEKNGVVVVVIPYEIEKHDAFSVWADTDPRLPVIVMSAGVPGDRQRWSLAHELGHLVIHHIYSSSTQGLENEANAFAAEFLLPERAVQDSLNATLTLTILADLKSRWGVSMDALIARAFQLNFITDGQRRYLYRQMVQKKWDLREPVVIPPEKPRLLRKLAEALYGTNVDARQIAERLSAPTHLLKPVLNAYASAIEIRTGKIRKIEEGQKGRLLSMMPRRKYGSEGV